MASSQLSSRCKPSYLETHSSGTASFTCSFSLRLIEDKDDSDPSPTWQGPQEGVCKQSSQKPWFQGVSAGVASDETGKGGGREVRISFPVLGPDKHGELLPEGFREKLVVFVS